MVLNKLNFLYQAIIYFIISLSALVTYFFHYEFEIVLIAFSLFYFLVQTKVKKQKSNDVAELKEFLSYSAFKKFIIIFFFVTMPVMTALTLGQYASTRNVSIVLNVLTWIIMNPIFYFSYVWVSKKRLRKLQEKQG